MAGVLYDSRLGHVDRQLANISHVVAYSFNVFGNEQEAGCASSRRRICDHHIQEIVEQTVVNLVDFIVARNDLARGDSIVRSERIERRAEHPGSVLGHAGQVDVGLHLRLVVEIDGCTSDVASMVRNTLEDGRNLRDGYDEPEIPRGGLSISTSSWSIASSSLSTW
jgi:hypothetical protein